MRFEFIEFKQAQVVHTRNVMAINFGFWRYVLRFRLELIAHY